MESSQSNRENSFEKKVRIFSHDYLKCCVYISTVNDPKNEFSKKLYSTLISTSMLLEDFLDYHGAKNNKNWYFYRELSAAVRHLSLGANFQKHLTNRLAFYDLAEYSSRSLPCRAICAWKAVAPMRCRSRRRRGMMNALFQ